MDAKDVVDGMARAAVLAAIGIGSRCQHRHLLRLLFLHTRRSIMSLLAGRVRLHPQLRRRTGLPRKFGEVVDVRTNQVVMRVCSGASGIWPMEPLFDRTGTPYLASGWRRFCQRHDILAGHLLVFNFDGDHQITVIVFDKDICRRRYVAPARGKPAVFSSSDDEDDQ
jgi:hypothetical protein